MIIVLNERKLIIATKFILICVNIFFLSLGSAMVSFLYLATLLCL